MYLNTNSAQDRVLCVDLLVVVILFNVKLNVLRMWRLEMKAEISKSHWGYFSETIRRDIDSKRELCSCYKYA